MAQTQTWRPSFEGWIGRTVVDECGRKVGKVSHVYMNDETGQPKWITVKTGRLSRSNAFVPLEGAVMEGRHLVIPYSREMVMGSLRGRA